MPLKNIRQEFFPLTDKVVGSSAPLSHSVSRGKLRGSEKIWIKKEMKLSAVAKIEIMAQEFFRLILPHQPETRLLQDPTYGTSFILSEEVPGYRVLPDEPAHFTSGRYTGLGQALLISVFLQEIDLKNGNICLDKWDRVIKIDGDWCFAQALPGFGGCSYGLTPKTIDSLPYPQDFYAFNWLDLVVQDTKFPSSSIVEPALSNSQLFREEVNQAMLKVCLLPDLFIERYVDAIMPAGAQHFIDFIKTRKETLLASAMQNTSFKEYLKTPKAKEDIVGLIDHMNSFVINGDIGVVRIAQHEIIADTVMKQLQELVSIVVNEEKSLGLKEEGDASPLSINKTLLAEIYDNRVNDTDRLVINYVERMREQLDTNLSLDELLTYQKQFEDVLKSVRSVEVQAVKMTVRDLRDSARWWTVGKNEKASRIENAIVNTPLEERTHIITAKGSANKVQEALASHRHWGYRGVVYKNNNNEINPDKEADTFKQLKKKFSETRHNDDGSLEEESGPSL
jgi:hypothetical protein